MTHDECFKESYKAIVTTDYRRTTSLSNIRKQNNTNKIAALFALIKKHGMQNGELSPLRIRWTLFIAFHL